MNKSKRTLSELNPPPINKPPIGKKSKKLNDIFKGKSPLDILPTHDNELSPINDLKTSYQIRQAIKTNNIISCNTLISFVIYI